MKKKAAADAYDPSKAPFAEREFHYAMIEDFEKVGKQTGYWPHYWLRLVRKIGGVEAAKQVLSHDEVSDGFLQLRRLGRLDLTLERDILRPKFEELFSEELKATARARLKSYGYRLPDERPDANDPEAELRGR